MYANVDVWYIYGAYMYTGLKMYSVSSKCYYEKTRAQVKIDDLAALCVRI